MREILTGQGASLPGQQGATELHELHNKPSHNIYIYARTNDHSKTWDKEKQFVIHSCLHKKIDYAVREPVKLQRAQKIFGDPEESVRGDKIDSVPRGSVRTITFS